MAARQGPGIFSMKREKKETEGGRSWGGGPAKSRCGGGHRGRGMETGEEAGPGRLASNYSISA